MANLPGSIKNLNTLLGEQLTEGGGGGSSDFSTATVTIVKNYDEIFGLGMPTIDDDFMSIEGDKGIGSGTYTIVINTTNGIYLVGDSYDMGEPQISVSGDAMHIPDTLDVIVKGDCTITIS